MPRWALIAALLLASCPPPALAQEDWPARPVKIVVGYPAGGVADAVTRLYAAGLSERFGKQFIVENKPGAGTNIGAAVGAHPPPDRYALYVAHFAPHPGNRWLYK